MKDTAERILLFSSQTAFGYAERQSPAAAFSGIARRSRPGGQGQRRALDLSLPSGNHNVSGRVQSEGFRAARRVPRGKAGQHGEAQLLAGAECQLHAGPEMGGVPLQHVRRYVCVWRGSSESAMKLMAPSRSRLGSEALQSEQRPCSPDEGYGLTAT